MRTRKLLRRKGTRQAIGNQHLRDYLETQRLEKTHEREKVGGPPLRDVRSVRLAAGPEADAGPDSDPSRP
jgi:hypothetical protein